MWRWGWHSMQTKARISSSVALERGSTIRRRRAALHNVKKEKEKKMVMTTTMMMSSTSNSNTGSQNQNHRECDAFTERNVIVDAQSAQRGGPLAGKTVAIKDIIDVEGTVTGFGHPLWRAQHQAAAQHAPVVRMLLDAGSTIVGKTHMDELAWALFGENAHFGTPRNPAAPGRVPGGSSSGSASAVSAGTVDIGIGTDTGGSVRVPASYCGIYGIRPTHGRVSLAGCCALAPSFDTLGWFARDMDTLDQVGRILLDKASPAPHFGRWLVAKDAFALADEQTQALIYGAISKVKRELVSIIGSEPEEMSLDGDNEFKAWIDAFRILQSHEVWRGLGGWVTENNPALGPGIKERFEFAKNIQRPTLEAAEGQRGRIRRDVLAALGEDGLLMLPTTPGPPPLCNASPEVADRLRVRLLKLTSISGLTGLPQISVPCGQTAEGPVGLSFIGPPGSDEQLMQICSKIDRVMRE